MYSFALRLRIDLYRNRISNKYRLVTVNIFLDLVNRVPRRPHTATPSVRSSESVRFNE
jgi:hypothetical protein